jgi:hypothetical protein
VVKVRSWGKVLVETKISPAWFWLAARWRASRGMKSLMLAVTRARLVSVARARIWSSGSPMRGRVGYGCDDVVAFGA